MKNIRSELTNSIIYIVSSAITAAIPLLALPILTSHLTPEEYGKIGMFQAFYLGSSALVSFSINIYCERKFFSNESVDYRVIISNALAFILLMVFVLISVPRFIYIPILESINIPIIWYYYSILCLLSNILFTVSLSLLSINRCSILYALVSVFYAFFNISTSIFLIVVYDMGDYGRVLGLSLTSFLFIVIFISILCGLKKINLNLISFNRQIEIFKFGLSLWPHAFGFFILNFVDRIWVSKELGSDVAGFYILALQLAGVILLVYTSVNKAYIPWAYSHLSSYDENSLLLVKKSILYAVISSVAIALFVFFISPYLLSIFISEKFNASSQLFRWLMLGSFASGIYVLMSSIVIYFNENKLLSKVTFVSVISNFILLFLFIPTLGVNGAVIAFILTRTLQVVIVGMKIRLLFNNHSLGCK
ncbi:oligosaccharide flippase family protein [Vibrio lentus]